MDTEVQKGYPGLMWEEEILEGGETWGNKLVAVGTMEEVDVLLAGR
jgi:hypothetical protein